MTYDKEMLVKRACDARLKAYSPYSRFCVGAALLCADGEIYEGANIENASYGATNCAERTAIFKAVNEGKRDFKAISIVGAKRGDDIENLCAPCGICRQVMQEFCRKDFVIIVATSTEDYKKYTLQELLPFGFGGLD